MFVQLLEDLRERERGVGGERERERDPGREGREFIPSIHHRAKLLVALVDGRWGKK